ncbi:MAG TPA: hypothetical protein PK280_00610 [Planctomycetota bacterium]|nr:hypothetical protein [Planctomycetota bacterium]
MFGRIAITGLFCSLLCATAPAGEPPAAAGNLDLMAGYWRHYFMLSPARLAADPAAPAATGKDTGCYEFVYSGHGERSPLTLLIKSAPPPADWAAAEFNDSAWQRARLPFTAGHPRPPCFSSEGCAPSHGVGLSCFRQQLLVDDPAKVKRLTIRLAYRGGAVVYVNGQEIGRGHLPAGKVAADVGGVVYPAEAYTLQGRPLPEFSRAWGKGDYRTGEPVKNKSNPEAIGYHSWWNGGNYQITRPEWDELFKLRNRTLGPLEVPAGLLRKGVNVVAVEVHRSDLNAIVTDRKRLGDVWDSMGGYSWLHGGLLEMDAAVDPPGAVALEGRPAGLQAWSDDLHRRYLSPEFGPSGSAAASPVRLVGARGGTYSGQVVLGTDKAINGLSASVTELTSAGGGKIPAAAVSVRFARGLPLSTPVPTAGLNNFDTESGQSANITLELQRLAGNRLLLDKAANAKTAAETLVFDQLGAAAPASVPAGSCQPVWVTVAVPRDAAPGEYSGALALKAGAEEVRVPLRLQVMDWTLPEPQKFETVVALEQSPYGVAKQYKVAAWSDEHLKLMTASFRQLSRVNNAIVIVPVAMGSEFGNNQDSPVVFVKKADGSWGCDLSRLEKYLDVALKAGCTPRAVCAVVYNDPFYGASNIVKLRVLARDESSGKTEGVDLPALDSPDAKKVLEPFAKGFVEVLKKRGLEKAGCWGYPWDGLDANFFGMVKAFGEVAPEVGWARGCHAHSKGMNKAAKDPFTLVTSIYDLREPLAKDKATGRWVVCGNRGWKNPAMRLVFPRVLSSAITLYTDSVPFCFRIAPERAELAGVRGIGRMGADYWAGIYKGGHVGATVNSVLGPGPEGAESTARFECLVEGVQETEARIFLERKLEEAWGQTGPGRAAQAMLDRRIEETLILPPGSPSTRIGEYCGGWQERSWDLYAAAAAAAGGKAPGAEERARFFTGSDAK